MNYILGVIVFSIVLFLYLHIYYHLKTSNELDIYELENPSKEKLEELCDFRQPVMFDYDIGTILDTCSINFINNNYSAFDVNIRDINNKKDDNDLYVPLAFGAAKTAIEQDKQSKLLIENNNDFLEETGLIKNIRYNDVFLRPAMVSNCYYDWITGSEGVKTPLRYEMNFRNYIIVNEGEIKVKLSPPKNAKYLYPKMDYENFEFTTPINIWEPQDKYKIEMNKIKTLEINLTKGKILYIPAYWWYSIKFTKDTSVTLLKYRTYMNNIAIFPHLFRYFLQYQNTIMKTAKTVSSDETLISNKDE